MGLPSVKLVPGGFPKLPDNESCRERWKSGYVKKRKKRQWSLFTHFTLLRGSHLQALTSSFLPEIPAGGMRLSQEISQCVLVPKGFACLPLCNVHTGCLLVFTTWL